MGGPRKQDSKRLQRPRQASLGMSNWTPRPPQLRLDYKRSVPVGIVS
jgi:hypothetical protein